MKLSKIFILAILALINLNLFAKSVNIDDANVIAKNFYELQYSRVYGKAPVYHAVTTDAIWVNNEISYYISNFSKGGFVLVSGDDNAFPIIGFSLELNFDSNNVAPSLEWWLSNVSKSIQEAKSLSAETGYKSLWEKLTDKNEIKKMNQKSVLSVGPLLTLRWNQDEPYNNDCPANSQGPGGHCYTGCVATAMAQIMKYHNYPENGRDSVLYTGNQLVDFEHTYYRWSEMSITANSTSASSIAELMFHCGVTVYMNYGPDGSASFSGLVPYALIHNFRYHPAAGYIERKNVEDKNWDLMVRNDLDMLRPVYYSGSGTGGHAFVCDGYTDTCFYHFNWGWGGSGNGYFYNKDLTPSGSNFSEEQGAVFNIMPYYSSYCKDGRVMTDLGRTFSDGSDMSYYWNNTHCDWLIAPDSASKITLSFSSFSTQANADFVYVYDGADSTATLMGKFSGNQLPPTLVSSTGQMYIVFTTDSAVQSFGWEAYYEADNINVPETYLENSISFYPNPCSDILNVSIGREKTWNGNISLYNVTGQLVKSKDIVLENSNAVAINISNLPVGFYLLKAKGADGEFVQKFVKK